MLGNFVYCNPTKLYFGKEEWGTVNHDYLFELDTPAAQKGYETLMCFLETCR